MLTRKWRVLETLHIAEMVLIGEKGGWRRK